MTIGERLRLERERAQLTQTELARRAGVTKNTQGNYERNQGSPGADYLAAIHEAGLDINVVVLGQPGGATSPDEALLLSAYRAASPALKAAAMAVLTSSGAPPAAGGVHVAGDQLGNVNTGTQTNTAPMTFNVGREKKGPAK